MKVRHIDKETGIKFPIIQDATHIISSFDDESWEIYVNLDGPQMVELHNRMEDDRVKKIIVEELRFRDEDPVWNDTDFGENRDNQWKDALDSIEQQ